MTPARFRECLTVVGWSQAGGAARFLGRTGRQMRRYASGESPIPDEDAALLERLVAWIEENRPRR